jgi:integrase
MRLNALKSNEITTLPAGEHVDGLGLYLVVKSTGGRSWMFGFTWAGKRKKLGLGSAYTVTLEQARNLALDARKLVNEGIDPRLGRQAKPEHRTSPTFLDYARTVMATKTHNMKDKSVAQWVRGVETYAKPLHRMEIASIDRRDIVACLAPLWLTIPIAANAFRARLEVIFDHAKSNYMLPDSHPNPADWAMLKHLLPRQPAAGTIRGGHKSLPYAELPAFWAQLVARDTVSSQTLQFVILTGVRTREAMQCSWDQVNLDTGRWDLPGKVMKNTLIANVPLSSDAVALLRGIKARQEQAGLDTTKGYVFPGLKRGTMQSENTLLKLIQVDLGCAVTTHGFRSTIKTWLGEKTTHDKDTQEYILHHITGDAAEQAYKRGDFWEKRQAALQDWADYVTGRQFQAPKRGRPALTVVAA